MSQADGFMYYLTVINIQFSEYLWCSQKPHDNRHTLVKYTLLSFTNHC